MRRTGAGVVDARNDRGGRRYSGRARRARKHHPRLLYRQAERGNVIPFLDEADLRVAQPIEADNVLCVDGLHYVFAIRQHTDPVLGQEAPGLTGNYVEVINVVVVFTERLAYARSKAVALAVVGVGRGTEKVHFVIALQVLSRINIAPSPSRQSGSAARSRETLV